MQRSPLPVIPAITMAIGTCLTLVASLFIILFTQIDYFVPYHYGTRLIDAPFFVRLGIIGFELFAFLFSLLSAIQTLRKKEFNIFLGAVFLLIGGLLFFANYLTNIFLPNLMDFSSFAWWWLLQGFFGFPIVFVAS